MNKIIINNKICDNSPACGGIEICPTGAPALVIFKDGSILGKVEGYFFDDAALGEKPFLISQVRKIINK